jgi:tetratricopeptide (TPR) repeat protein
VWDTTPLTPAERLRREAMTVVNRLAEEVALKEEMLTQIRNDASLGEPLWQLALKLAARHREDPSQLNGAALRIVNQPGLDAAKYRLALRQAEAALRLASPEYYFYGTDRPRTVFGIAQYRLGHYREALESLKRAQDEHEARAKSSPSLLSFASKEFPPWNHAIMAMAYFQLGEQDQARALFGRLREIMKDPYWGGNPSAQGFLREAEMLIEGKSAEPKK